MSIQKQQNKDQHKHESLSAFIDAEQSDNETSQIVDALLNDSAYKEQYIRLQLMNEYLQEQVQTSILETKLRDNISLALDDLPGHFVDDAVSLQSLKTEDVSRSSGFNRFFENRMLSGISIAASVMFVTLFTLQGLDSEPGITPNMTDNSLVSTNQTNSSLNQLALANKNPSLIQSVAELPASYVSTGTELSKTVQITNNDLKQQYHWIEADPALSQQVRQYVNEHEKHRAAYNLRPQIRTATYQISD
ncbi:MAG: hypothetical protein KZQ64_01720 [gamma proteobacterium symbiont of Bathyaustriella thionipta]|nr:hypothetical protein [gamma proteobacterium symbiont of Bathyaustriella thionipta]MCU7949871.1 hypothetical protein [gamma proteobacterium symbiont of Bathyaustriella thionipta]MCU7952113.1 hypothetical protein [gamma proteobacterium symbiont of Bathyaustriella thionipta]MCU7956467.1 hypothetical protein [gamma proteobacterium symbiont of Bathyaustriella thionipta]MCU7965794.1 hypothetical protein [gamma proteobacterium symbiont of Bathyaustriella thionipta]